MSLVCSARPKHSLNRGLPGSALGTDLKGLMAQRASAPPAPDAAELADT
jgi:hypothetical protein